ncbi:quinon protein alcohol dehydrogenase-like superfamily [Infundibulicybe gibba]|nr:quinon protein alcohol dehydrogenase-like superfamily [Infundibulicybe gibba]
MSAAVAKMEDNPPLAVHRCRFVDYAPSAITALAFPRLALPSLKDKKKPLGKKSLRPGTLAIGHANGNIDLCEWSGSEHEYQSSQAWVSQKTLSGPYPSKVDSLAFVIRHPDDFGPDDVPTCSDLRLFSSGGGSELLEWDIDASRVRRTISSQGGSIWSMAVNPASSMLALGCEDGTVRLLSLAHDTLTHHRRFDRVKCRVLSLAWGPPVARQRNQPPSNDPTSSDDEDEDDWTDSWLVTGGSDSSIRKWDISTGRVLDRMGTDKIRGERTLVWAINVLGDGTIISGDSLGMVKFWDSRTCTQLHTFNAHGADVLCLTVGPDGSTVYTSGVDQKTTQISLVKTTNPDKSATNSAPSSSRWVQTASRRMHSHDVRALAMWPPYTPLPSVYMRQSPTEVAPVLASGGLDMSVVVTPAALPSSTVGKVVNPLCTSAESTFEDSYHRRLAYTSGPSSTLAIQVSPTARLILCMRETGVTIWSIPNRATLPGNENLDDEDGSSPQPWEKLMEMELSVHTNLVASAISNDGQWLVASDFYTTKLFRLQINPKKQIQPKRIRNFSSILQPHMLKSSTSTGGLAFRFTPDSSKLIMSTTMTSDVLVIDLGTGDDSPRVLRKFDHHRMSDSVSRGRTIKGRQVHGAAMDRRSSGESESEAEEDGSPINAKILRMAVSPDGQWLATSDNQSRTHIFNLDSIQYHTTLPSFAKPAQALCFDPARPSSLMIAFPDNTMQIFDVESRQFPDWGKELCSSLPKRLKSAHDPILGLTFDPEPPKSNSNQQYVLVWGSTWMCRLPLYQAVTGGDWNKKRRRDGTKRPAPYLTGEESLQHFKMITHYRPILCVDFLSPRELLVVERPLVDVLSTLPPAYFKHRYGTS